MLPTLPLDEKIEVHILRLLEKLAAIGMRIFLALLVFGVTSVFGAGVFFARVDERLKTVESALGRVETTVLGDYGVRLRLVESTLSTGVLPQADRRLERLEKRVFQIESKP